uniref:Uncharacterized protein n=1 Tax=Sphaerodactylus townsendi TaxID=933632 RepID=A0ACB8FH01_9SAUR
MTEIKAKGDTRAHPSSSDPRDGSLLLRVPRRQDLGPFRKETVEALDLSLDGLLYPRSSDEEEEREEEEEEGEPREYLPEEEDAKGDSSSIRPSCGSPADKDALERVLDTFLVPSSTPGSPPAAWSFFGSEISEFPGASMNRRPPDDKAGDASGPTAAALLPPPPEASPWKAPKDADGTVFRSRRAKDAAPDDASKGEPGFTAPEPGLEAASIANLAPTGRAPGAVSSSSDPGDFLGPPPLPLNAAFLAARTRQLLDVEEYERGGPFGALPQRLASPPELAHFPCSPKEPHYLFAGGDFQPGLKIKEEGLAGPAGAPPGQLGNGGVYLSGQTSPLARALPGLDYAPPQAKSGGPHEASSSSSSSLESVLYKAEVAAAAAAAASSSYGPAPCKVSPGCIVSRDSLSLPSTSNTAPPALYQPLALHGGPPLVLPPAGIKDGFPQLYPSYLSYISTCADCGPLACDDFSLA